MRPPPVVSVVGKSNVGKTTLVEKLVMELKRRGYRVGTIKHDVHGFDLDTPGKDSWRHREAGSDCVVIASPLKVAMIWRVQQDMEIDEIVAMLPDVDIVLTEGYKRGNKPKIEVSRRERGQELLCGSDELIAIASDQPHDLPVLQFELDDAVGIVNYLEQLYLHEGREEEGGT